MMMAMLEENYKCRQVESGDTLASCGNVFAVKISIFNASSTLGY